MCAPSPPPAPDYAAAAAAQGAANLDAARAQGRINNPNVYGPTGTQTVTWEGDTPTLRQTLSPAEQAIYDANAANRLGLAGLGTQGIDSMRGLIGTRLDFSGAPGMGSAFQPGMLPDVFDPSLLGAMPEAYKGPGDLPEMPADSEAVRRRVIDAMMLRANEDFGRRQEEENASLIARGIAPGTEAYERERDRLERARNDYRAQAEIAGGTEAERSYGMDMGRRQQGFNEAIQNALTRYQQAMGIRQQGASEQAQRFQQGGQREELRARGQAQQFGQQDQLRRQFLTELLTQRQTPLNEIIGLMGGSQVQNPFTMPGYAQNTQVAPSPIFGAATAQDQANMNRYGIRSGSYNNMMTGLFGLGSAGLGLL